MQYFNLLRQPVTLSAWGGQVLSTAGDRLYALAMLWLSLQVTGSAKLMAITSLFEGLALTVVSLLAGALVDRWSRVTTTISVDVIRAVLVMVVPIANLLGMLNIYLLIALGVLMGALTAVFEPAFNALLPALVPSSQFPGFAGMMDTPSRFARLLGPGMAGILLVWMPVVGFFTLDALSFVLSAVSIAVTGCLVHNKQLLKRPPTPPRHRRLQVDIVMGIRTVIQDRLIFTILVADSLGNLAFVAYTLGGLLFATRQLHVGVGGYGVLIAAYGIGSLIGNFVAGNVELGPWRPLAAIGGWAGIGCGFIVLGAAPSMTVAVTGITISGAFGALAHVSRATLVGQRVPSANLGKVYSLQNMATTITSTVGTLLCGILLDKWPASLVIVWAGAYLVLADVVCLTTFGLWFARTSDQHKRRGSPSAP